MVNVNATTPQLKAVKNYLDAYTSLDVNNVERVLSKNFKFQTFPETTDLPEQAKGAYIERFRRASTLMTKMDVRIREPPSNSQTDIHHPQINVHEVIEAPGKVVVHVCPSTLNRHIVSDHNTYS